MVDNIPFYRVFTYFFNMVFTDLFRKLLNYDGKTENETEEITSPDVTIAERRMIKKQMRVIWPSVWGNFPYMVLS